MTLREKMRRWLSNTGVTPVGRKMKQFVRLIAVLALFLFSLSLNAYAQSEFVYLNNGIPGTNSVSVFSLATNGTLTEISGSPFPTGGSGFTGSPILIVGNFLYAGNSNSNSISAFSIDPRTGILTVVPGSPFSIDGFSFGTTMTIAATPDSKLLMASTITSGTISIFSIAGDGRLAPEE